MVAIERAYVSTGAAVRASGVTAIAGFAVLIASDIAMLRQFGISTVVDLTVALLGVLLVLPAALVFAEQHGPLRRATSTRGRCLRRALTRRAGLRRRRDAAPPAPAAAARRCVKLVPSLPRRRRPPCLRTASATSASRDRDSTSAAPPTSSPSSTSATPSPTTRGAGRPSRRARAAATCGSSAWRR